MNKKISTLICCCIAVLSAHSQTPNWSDNVAKIFYANCTPCHRPGGIGSFSLMTYQDAFPMASSIDNYVSNSIMPPWTANPDYKHFVHERVLSQTDIDAIHQWVVNGAPSGDLRFAPPAPTYSNTTQLGTVNLSLRIPDYTVSSNNDVYHNFVLPSGLSQLNYATAVEIIPGNSGIVHHVLVFSDSTNNAINPNSAGGTGSTASKLIYVYAPGGQPYFTPVGTGLRLPANTRIILQIHYAPGNQGQLDSTRINFKTTTTTQRSISVYPILNHLTSLTNGPLSIPSNQTRTFNEQATIPGNWTFLTAFPHMHLIGKSIHSYALNTNTNDTIRFVKIPEWSFHWQTNYVFPNAVKVPNGYSLKATAFYDNTTNNPDNPSSPPQNVSAGENTTDEMMMVFFSYMPYQNGDENLIIDKRILPLGATTFCQGQSVDLKTISGNGYSYQWYKNGTIIGGATTYLYNVTQAGSYTVSITLGPNNAVSDPMVVTVNSNPTASINLPGTTEIPYGGSITLNAVTGNGYTYQWYKDDVLISGETASSYDATTAGSYTVEVYNGCYAVSSPVVLTEQLTYGVATSASPIAGGTTTGAGTYGNGTSVSVTATANNGYTFNNWTENGNAVSNNVTYTFTLSAPVSLVANFDQTVGISDSDSYLDGISIFPNPAQGVVNIACDRQLDLSVFNTSGQLVLAAQLNKAVNRIELKEPGVYLLQLKDKSGKKMSRRVVIQQ